MLSLLNEETKPLKHYGPKLKKSTDAMAYWIKNGLRAPDGSIVRLKAVKLGDWRTSDAWVEEFLSRVNGYPVEQQGSQSSQPSQAGAVLAVA